MTVTSPLLSHFTSAVSSRAIGVAVRALPAAITVSALAVAGAAGLLAALTFLVVAGCAFGAGFAAYRATVRRQVVDLSALYRGPLDCAVGEYKVDLPDYLMVLKGQVAVAKHHHPDMAVMLDSALFDAAKAAQAASAMAASGRHEEALTGCQGIENEMRVVSRLLSGPTGDLLTARDS